MPVNTHAVLNFDKPTLWHLDAGTNYYTSLGCVVVLVTVEGPHDQQLAAHTLKVTATQRLLHRSF